MKNIFEQQEVKNLIGRINNIENNAQPLWGKMSADKMLAHCNVTYEMAFENKHKKPKGLKKWLLKKFIKPLVTNEKPYKKNGRTAPEFLITDSKNFEEEKARLINYLKKVQELGETYFNNKESHSFGKLTTKQWNNMFYKHLDHHLNQFGV